MPFPFFRRNRGKIKKDAVARVYGTSASADSNEVSFLRMNEVSWADDLNYYYERDPQAHREIQKVASDPWRNGVDVESEDENAMIEIQNMADGFEPIAVEGRIASLVGGPIGTAEPLSGFALIYKNFRDAAQSPAEPVVRAIPYSDRKMVDYSVFTASEISGIKWDTEPESETYGKIEYAEIYTQKKDRSYSIRIHGSRLIPVVDRSMSPGKRYGRPYLLKSLNLYTVKNNLELGMGEAYFRKGSPFNLFKAPEGAKASDMNACKNMAKRINTATWAVAPPGWDMTQYSGDPTNPEPFWKWIKMAISPIPESILFGVQAGAVSGSETNLKIWYEDLRKEQKNIWLPILNDLVVQYRKIGLLRSKSDYDIFFPSLDEPDGKDEASTELFRAGAFQRLIQSGVDFEDAAKIIYPSEEIKMADQAPIGANTGVLWNLSGDARAGKPTDLELINWSRRYGYDTGAYERIYESHVLQIQAKQEEKYRNRVERVLSSAGVPSRGSEPVVPIENVIPGYEGVDTKTVLETLSGISVSSRLAENALAKNVDANYLDATRFFVSAVVGEPRPGFPITSPDVKSFIDSRVVFNTKAYYNDLNRKTYNTLAEGIQKGEGINELMSRIGETYNGKATDLKAMSRTLAKEISEQARYDAYKKDYVERVIWLATQSERTCSICMANDGNVYSNDDSQGMIPAHINCRCTFIPEDTKPGGW